MILALASSLDKRNFAPRSEDLQKISDRTAQIDSVLDNDTSEE